MGPGVIRTPRPLVPQDRANEDLHSTPISFTRQVQRIELIGVTAHWRLVHQSLWLQLPVIDLW
jgi:hypothetical protein